MEQRSAPIHPTKMIEAKFVILILALTVSIANALLASYGVCQTGCNAVGVACYAAAGSAFGIVTAGAGIPAVMAGCNSALGVCMTGCVAALFSPLP